MNLMQIAPRRAAAAVSALVLMSAVVVGRPWAQPKGEHLDERPPGSDGTALRIHAVVLLQPFIDRRPRYGL